MDFESNSGSWNDDVLDTVHVLEHPLISRMIGTSIAKEHPVESIHEVVSTVK